MEIGNIQIPVKAVREGQVTVAKAAPVSEAEALENFRRKIAERQRQGMAVSTPVLTEVERLQALNPTGATGSPDHAAAIGGGWTAFTAYAGKNPLQTVAAVAGIAAALKYLLAPASDRNRRD